MTFFTSGLALMLLAFLLVGISVLIHREDDQRLHTTTAVMFLVGTLLVLCSVVKYLAARLP